MEWRTIETTTVRNDETGVVTVTDLKKLDAGKIVVWEVATIAPGSVTVRQFDKKWDAVDYYRKVR